MCSTYQQYTLRGTPGVDQIVVHVRTRVGNVLARVMGKNLTNRYPDGKLLGESLEHMLDYLTGMRFQYSSIINTLKSYTPQIKKKQV